ncbi:protein PLANT CADMIUM RESISTANCE 6-like [Andrographis paniculata]|uniref:protein PLANT CADMIUM RESISTANCE 6-like n=1 Tax=Andrographis paniculata TaxID=175694 RepID=UPI0021E95C94|nr:protein PLANT CADMIUM RESISTANCE 6-like [Andrographis paniculata]
MGRVGDNAGTPYHHHRKDQDLYEPPPPPPPAHNFDSNKKSRPAATQDSVAAFPPPPNHDEDDHEDLFKTQAFPPPPPDHNNSNHYNHGGAVVVDDDDDDDDLNKTQAFPPRRRRQDHMMMSTTTTHLQPAALPPSTRPPAAAQTNNNYIGIPVGHPFTAAAPNPMLQQPPLQQIPNQPWKTHLFDCMANPQNALITVLFPCVTFGQIAEIVDSGTTSCGTSGMVYGGVACCLAVPCVVSCGYRSKMRAKFGLAESPAPDCLVHCCCECCALCQEYRELHARGLDPSIGWAGNVARLQQQIGMMTPPMRQMIG